MNKSDILKLAQIVREETGNLVQEKNYPMLESRMRSHITNLGLNSIDEYWEHFKNNESDERAKIQSLMTTHYTFFFREYAHFEVLEKWITKEINYIRERYLKNKTPFQVWSAACSRGQEVYSLAMFLEENLVQKYNIPYEIFGTDIDPESVTYAKNGVYNIQEVNTIPMHFLKDFWKKGTGQVKNFAAVHPNLKSKTTFAVQNLLELNSLPISKKFDVIFCRNVFIYFSENDVKKISTDLMKKLNEKALFISGVSEPLRLKDAEMEIIGPSCYEFGLTQKQKTVTDFKIKNVNPEVATSGQAQAVAKTEDKKYKVLCVDDSSTIQTLMKKIFGEDPNCEGVDSAFNGLQAKEKLEKNNYNLITLDIHMPEVNGIEFLEKYYNKRSHPPVIMISSVNRTDIDLATKALKLGAFDYVEKPAMNSLQKSKDEILTKTRMALRSNKKDEAGLIEHDLSISTQIVVPDASQCVRIIFGTSSSVGLLKQIVQGQKTEYRSPAQIICMSDLNSNIESEILNWTDKKVVSVKPGTAVLFRPNNIYLCDKITLENVWKDIKYKSASIQIVSEMNLNKFSQHKISDNCQVLVDETVGGNKYSVEKDLNIRVSDITPATSFPSLSIEFFANVRKAAV